MTAPDDAKLYLCATPIGNLGDITLRVRDILQNVDVICCEDTRNTLRLLNHLGIRKPLISCHEHNEAERADEIADMVRSGRRVAFVSDAGMPAISDPGQRLVRVFIDLELPFEVVPGASASLCAAVLSGLSTQRLYFCGFLPRDNVRRSAFLGELRRVSATLIIYENPLRVGPTLGELLCILGDRQCALVREITKLHEQSVRGTLSSLSAVFSETPPRGECVLVIAGADGTGTEETQAADAMLLKLLSSGVSVKDAAKQVSAVFDIPRSSAYSRAMELKAGL